jgi:hypothetical protein
MNLAELASLDAALERVKAALPKAAASESMVCSDIQDALPALIALANAAVAWRDAEDAIGTVTMCDCPTGELHDTTNAAGCALAEAEWSCDQAAEKLRKAVDALGAEA